MKIQKGEKLTVDNLLILIYGEVGIGKTSLALSTKEPIIIDAENGVRRSEFRTGKDIVVVNTFDELATEIQNIKPEKLFPEYQTIVIDTVDSLLERIREYIERQDYSLRKNTLRMYGVLKDHFNMMLSKLQQTGKDVILISHSSQEEINGIIRTTPKITGGSKELIKQRTDFIGYLSNKNGNRHLTFSPTEYYDGKNSCGLDDVAIPSLSKEPLFFDSIITEMKEKINRTIKEKASKAEVINKMLDLLINEENIDKANDLINQLRSMKLSKNEKLIILEKIEIIEKLNGWKYDKNQKLFIANSETTKDVEKFELEG